MKRNKENFGFQLLIDQIAAEVSTGLWQEAYEWEHSPKSGDTPIERLLYCAVYLCLLYVPQEYRWQLAGTSDMAKAREDPRAGGQLIVQRQAQIPNVGRVDFLFNAAGHAGWRQLIVECDGHDFHERTKEQAARDRSRDRTAALAGYDVFRFTGSELWTDPLDCACHVIEWANKGV